LLLAVGSIRALAGLKSDSTAQDDKARQERNRICHPSARALFTRTHGRAALGNTIQVIGFCLGGRARGFKDDPYVSWLPPGGMQSAQEWVGMIID